ncbi:MAG: ABC transporter ATP-binding protein [Polyangiaceae bacterium]
MGNAVDVDSVRKTFTIGSRFPFGRRGRKIEALGGVTLGIRNGEVYGLVGRNGYGKTTLIKCICSLLEPDSGTIHVCGLPSTGSSHEVRKRVGFVSSDERSFYWRISGQTERRFFGRLHGLDEGELEKRIDALAKTFEVTALLERRFHEYSTGNRQRLAVVRALLHDPKLLILDEPTRSLNPFAAAALRETIRAWVGNVRERSVLITSHNLDEVAELSSRVGIMCRGRIAEEGSMRELRKSIRQSRINSSLVLDGRRSRAHESAPTDDGEDTVSTGVDPERGQFVEFRRHPEDARLDSVLRHLVSLGARIHGFERRELSLQDIINR